MVKIKETVTKNRLFVLAKLRFAKFAYRRTSFSRKTLIKIVDERHKSKVNEVSKNDIPKVFKFR
jgi:hypothetical protein